MPALLAAMAGAIQSGVPGAELVVKSSRSPSNLPPHGGRKEIERDQLARTGRLAEMSA
jgi:hypothetical protein